LLRILLIETRLHAGKRVTNVIAGLSGGGAERYGKYGQPLNEKLGVQVENKNFFSKLLDAPAVFLIIVGLLLFVAGANGGWSKVDVKIDSIGWRVAIALMGLIVVVIGGLSFWREKGGTSQLSKLTKRQAAERVRIEGEYHTSDTHAYKIFIAPLPASLGKDSTDVDYYSIRHADWNGVGFFDGEFFYSAFHINDKATPPNRRGNWGAHLARFSAKKKSFDVFMVELKDQEHFAECSGKWIRESDVQ